MVVASKGCVRWRLTVRGRAAHSSKPELGVNAIVEMARLIPEISADAVIAGKTEHYLVGRPTINVGTSKAAHRSTSFPTPVRSPSIGV